MFVNWKQEEKSPLLFKYPLNDETILNSSKYLKTLIVKVNKVSLTKLFTLNEDQTRILKVDVDRVFMDTQNKVKLINILTQMNEHFGEYHQSMSWVAGFLSILVEKQEDIINILVSINTKSIVALWSSCPIISSVYGNMIQREILPDYLPSLSNHLNDDVKLIPETYFQKWICTMGIKLIDFHSSVKFIHYYCTGGLQFVIHFCLNIFKQLEVEMYKTDNIYKVLELQSVDNSKLFQNHYIIKNIFSLNTQFSLNYYQILSKIEIANKWKENNEDSDIEDFE